MRVLRSLVLMIMTLVLALVMSGCGADETGGTGDGTGGTGGSDGQQTGTGVAEELRFTAVTLDGEPFDGTSLAGEPAVVWFWTPWCPTCQREAPDVARVAAANREVTFLGVAAQDDVDAMRGFVSRYGLDSFTHLADLDGEVWQRFGIVVQPAYAFIGADGSVQVVRHTLSGQQLGERVGMLTGS